MSRVPLSDEGPLPWDEAEDAPRCERCADQLEDGDAELCADCRAEVEAEDDDDPLFGKPLRRLADDMDGDNVE